MSTLGLNHRQKGKIAEQQVLEYLAYHHYQVLDTNAYNAGYEIDIIALNRKKRSLHFIEVKSTTKNDNPALWVTPKKQLRIYQGAKFWLYHHPKYQSYSSQFDVFCLKKRDNNTVLTRYGNAFLPYL